MNFAVIDKVLLNSFHELQNYFTLAGRTFVRIFQRPFYYREFAVQFDKLGLNTAAISTKGLLPGISTSAAV